MSKTEEEQVEAFMREVESFRLAALKEFKSFDSFKLIFDGKSEGGKPVFACPVDIDVVSGICKLGEVKEKAVGGLVFSGTEVSKKFGDYAVEFLVCPKNLLVGLFYFEELIASLILTPKENKAKSKDKVFERPASSGLYLAIFDKFSSWSKSKVADSGDRAGVDTVKHTIYANVLFRSFSDLPLEDRVLLISKQIGLSPVTVCMYLLASDVSDKKGLVGLMHKFSAESNGIVKVWRDFSGVSGLEARVRLVAETAGIGTATVCNYLLASDVSDKKGLMGLRNKFSAEREQARKLE